MMYLVFGADGDRNDRQVRCLHQWWNGRCQVQTAAIQDVRVLVEHDVCVCILMFMYPGSAWSSCWFTSKY